MMQTGLRGRAVATLLAIALVPALVFACVVLVQGSNSARRVWLRS
jgi:hypothetical protein